MTNSKESRAHIIISKVLALDSEFGSTVPARSDDRTRLARLIEADPRWRAWVTKGQRVVMGPVYEAEVGRRQVVFGERRIADPGCTTIDLECTHGTKLVANLQGSEIELFRYIPGGWEAWFDVDNGGDFAPLETVSFPRPGSPELKVLLESKTAKLPPLRRGPSAGEDLYFPRGRSRRRDWPGRASKFPPLS